MPPLAGRHAHTRLGQSVTKCLVRAVSQGQRSPKGQALAWRVGGRGEDRRRGGGHRGRCESWGGWIPPPRGRHPAVTRIPWAPGLHSEVRRGPGSPPGSEVKALSFLPRPQGVTLVAAHFVWR